LSIKDAGCMKRELGEVMSIINMYYWQPETFVGSLGTAKAY
jgi:hypothetical protein